MTTTRPRRLRRHILRRARTKAGHIARRLPLALLQFHRLPPLRLLRPRVLLSLSLHLLLLLAPLVLLPAFLLPGRATHRQEGCRRLHSSTAAFRAAWWWASQSLSRLKLPIHPTTTTAILAIPLWRTSPGILC